VTNPSKNYDLLRPFLSAACKNGRVASPLIER
jgi:hypothetical protein